MRVLSPLSGGSVRVKLGAAILLLLVVVPLLTDSFQVFLITRVLILCLAVLGLDIAWGYGGILNLGHAVFFGMGAYTFGVLTQQFGVGHVVVVLLAMVVPAVFALVFGYAILSTNLEEAYFGIVMLAVAALAPLLINSTGILGGSDGLTGIPQLTVASIVVEETLFYYLVLAITTLALLGSYVLLEQRPFGLRLQAIRINEGRTRVLGYNTMHYKLAAFVLSGIVTGFSGALRRSISSVISSISLPDS